MDFSLDMTVDDHRKDCEENDIQCRATSIKCWLHFVALIVNKPLDKELSMALLPSAEWRVAEAIAGIGYTNPFLPERVGLERRALGSRYIESGPIIILGHSGGALDVG